MAEQSRRAHAVLHPQRLAVITQLEAGSKTTAQLAELLPDIPAATLYRHLRVLTEAQIVTVERTRRVRGAVEKTYRLFRSAASLTLEDLAGATPGQQLSSFTSFVASLIGQFDRYLQRDTVDYLADGVGYRAHVLQLSPSEFAEMIAAVSGALAPYLTRPPSSERTPRTFATIVLPLDQPRPSPTPTAEDVP